MRSRNESLHNLKHIPNRSRTFQAVLQHTIAIVCHLLVSGVPLHHGPSVGKVATSIGCNLLNFGSLPQEALGPKPYQTGGLRTPKRLKSNYRKELRKDLND